VATMKVLESVATGIGASSKDARKCAQNDSIRRGTNRDPLDRNQAKLWYDVVKSEMT